MRTTRPGAVRVVLPEAFFPAPSRLRVAKFFMSRIAQRFAKLQRDEQAAFIPFITAGDPDAETSFAILERLPEAGADLIELGVPFSDPMADGPAIQASSLRALEAGHDRIGTVLEMVRRFRATDANDAASF